jgi:asparagine synthase (glutamine-hydrolysing)
LGKQLRFKEITEFFYYRRAIWRESELLIRNSLPWIGPKIGGTLAAVNAKDAVSQMMQLEETHYLPDDIMMKVDRASMAVSLESRAPLLDHRVVELAWRLPLSYKVRNGRGKWILREVLYRHVPRDLVDRPKAGFGVPINGWLRGPLRGWADELLDESRLNDQGLFNPTIVRILWRHFLEERLHYGYQFWVLLMFQAWFEKVIARGSR